MDCHFIATFKIDFFSISDAILLTFMHPPPGQGWLLKQDWMQGGYALPKLQISKYTPLRPKPTERFKNISSNNCSTWSTPHASALKELPPIRLLWGQEYRIRKALFRQRMRNRDSRLRRRSHIPNHDLQPMWVNQIVRIHIFQVGAPRQ